MSTIQVNGAIEFRFSVTDFDLAMKIQQLLKQHPRAIAKPADARQGDNGHAKRPVRSTDTKERILSRLAEKYASSSFPIADAAPFIESTLKHGSATTFRALRMGIAQGKLTTDKKGVYHFLGRGTTVQPQATESEKKQKDPIPLPTSI
jgi:hypothetical protein